jgi:hypothetical protein
LFCPREDYEQNVRNDQVPAKPSFGEPTTHLSVSFIVRVKTHQSQKCRKETDSFANSCNTDAGRGAEFSRPLIQHRKSQTATSIRHSAVRPIQDEKDNNLHSSSPKQRKARMP